MSDSADEKLKKRADKRKEKKRSREADAQKKKLTKQVERSQSVEKQKNDPKQVDKPDGSKDMRPRQETKPVDKKLKEGSELRKKLLKTKSNREVSEKERAISMAVRDEKKARRSNHLQEKAQGREALAKQQQGLQAEIRALNKLESVKESSGTEYTAKFSGFQSAIAAGPMGAASTGLRKLDPAMLINMARDEIGARVQKKLDPKIALKMEQLTTIARDLKTSNMKEPAQKAMPTVHVEREPDAAIKRIVNSKLRMKIREMKDRQKEPNRNPSKFDELNMPFRGVGGVGGI
ncbi:MAG: hypothetical protein WC714_27940 [Candidatus Obscuribacterales bacterium]